jgi:hypothetical protein
MPMRLAPILAALLAAALTAAPAAAELPAPELTASFPANQEEIAAPLDAITLIFAADRTKQPKNPDTMPTNSHLWAPSGGLLVT